MHPLDTLAADPDRLAEIEAAAANASHAVCTSSATGAVVDEAAVRRLDALLWPSLSTASGEPATRDGMRLWRLVLGFSDLLDGVYETGRGPIAPTFDEHDRAAEAQRGGWFRVRSGAYEAFSDLVRGNLLPPEARVAARAFWNALTRRDIETVERFLVNGLDLGELPFYGRPPPVYQVLAMHYEVRPWDGVARVVRLLVSYGAQPNPPEREWWPDRTALWLAQRHEDHEMARLIQELVTHGAPSRDALARPNAPPEAAAVVVRGTDRASGAKLSVRASTVSELRQRLAAHGVTRVEVTGYVSVDCHGAYWTDAYALADLPETLLDQVRQIDGQDASGFRFVFDVGA